MQELMHIIQLMQNRRFIDEIFGLQSVDSFIHLSRIRMPHAEIRKLPDK